MDSKADASFLRERAAGLMALASPCRLCPNECRAERAHGEVGRCGVGIEARVCFAEQHFSEEPPLVVRDCHNLNPVPTTHPAHAIVVALAEAAVSIALRITR